MELDFDVDDLGNSVLSGRVFENCQFHDLEIVPPAGRTARIEDCKFLNCSTTPGTCVIDGDVTLDRVVIVNLDCGDALQISSAADLREVVIAGEKPGALIVRPEADCGGVCSPPAQVAFQLDISGFLGSVEIVGMHGHMVRKDSSRQVTVRQEWGAEVDWRGLGIGPFSYWRIFIKKLSVFNAPEGVFSLPGLNDKHYEETLREQGLLQEVGLEFV